MSEQAEEGARTMDYYRRIAARFSQGFDGLLRLFGDRIVEHRGTKVTLRDAVALERDLAYYGCAFVVTGDDGVGRRLDPSTVRLFGQ